jgi:hypothetical protein
VNNY